MANKKELLDNAFNEAISTVPYNGMDPQTAAETIKGRNAKHREA